MPLWSPSSSVEEDVHDDNVEDDSVSSSSWDDSSDNEDTDTFRNRLMNNNTSNSTSNGGGGGTLTTSIPTTTTNNKKLLLPSYNLLNNNSNQQTTTGTNNATSSQELHNSNSNRISNNNYNDDEDKDDDDDETSESDSSENEEKQQQQQQRKQQTNLPSSSSLSMDDDDDDGGCSDSEEPPPASSASVPPPNVVLPSIEKERQLLILVLLAQVCALHDPTPRTFTIHVLELYERGILDHESIHFLYDLGLVPSNTTSITPTNSATAALSSPNKKSSSSPTYSNLQGKEIDPSATTTTSNERRRRRRQRQQQNNKEQQSTDDNTSKQIQNRSTENGITVVNNNNNNNNPIENNTKEFLRKRSLEASAIRTKLVEQEDSNNKIRSSSVSSSTKDAVLDNNNNNNNNNNNQQRTYQQSIDESDIEQHDVTSSSSANVPSSSSDATAGIKDHPRTSVPNPQPSTSSWSVKEHQLSLSRYQREFEQVCLLSSGSFGHVYKAINIMDQREYAIKRIQFNAEGYDRDTLQITIREVHCLAICDHPNVVRYYTSWLEPSWMTGATTVSGSHSNHLRALTNSSENTISESLNENDDDDDDYDNDEFNNNSNAVTNLVAAAKRGVVGNNRSDISDELKAYFKDPCLSDNCSSKRTNNNNKHHTTNHSVWGSESTSRSLRNYVVQDDDDVSDWTIRNNNNNNHRGRYESWKYNSSRDDIFFEDSATQERRSSLNISLQQHNSKDDSSIFDRTYDNDDTCNQQNNYGGGQIIVRRQQQQKQPVNFPQKVDTNHNGRSSNNNKKSYKYQICLFIQMQLCHPATLADWIRERNNNATTKNSSSTHQYTIDDRIHIAGQIFHQITSGLHHVHKKGIVHRDLKPANIFASTEDGLQFKIGDFGLSKLITSPTSTSSSSGSPRHYMDDLYHQRYNNNTESTTARDLLVTNSWNKPWGHTNNMYRSKWDDPLTSGVGTASYAAPEQVETTSYGSEADIFSLGLILLELLCCFSTEHERLQTFYDCRYRRKIPDELKKYPIAYQTILSCTEPKVTKRPTAYELEKLIISSLDDDRHRQTFNSNNNVYLGMSTQLLLMNEPYMTAVPTTSAVVQIDCVNSNITNDTDEVSKLRAELETLRGQVQSYKKLIEEKDQTIVTLREELSRANANKLP